MGKDTVVFRSDVDKSVKRPLMRYPQKVREYYTQYGPCELFHSANHKTHTGWNFVVVLKFQESSIANKVKQKYNNRMLQNDAKVTTAWFDGKQAKELGLPPPLSRRTKSRLTDDNTSMSSLDSSRVVVSSSQHEVSESEGSQVMDCLSPDNSRPNTPGRHRSRHTSLSSQDKERNDSSERPNSRISSYSSSRERGYSGQRDKTTSSDRTVSNESYPTISHRRSSKSGAEDKGLSQGLEREARKRRSTSPSTSYPMLPERSKVVDEWKKSVCVFDRLGPSSDRAQKERNVKTLSDSPSPRPHISTQISSRISREHTHSPCSIDQYHSSPSNSLRADRPSWSSAKDAERVSRKRARSDSYKEREREREREKEREREREREKERERKEDRSKSGMEKERKGERVRSGQDDGEKKTSKKRRRESDQEADSEGARPGVHIKDGECADGAKSSDKHRKVSKSKDRREDQICSISWDEGDESGTDRVNIKTAEDEVQQVGDSKDEAVEKDEAKADGKDSQASKENEDKKEIGAHEVKEDGEKPVEAEPREGLEVIDAVEVKEDSVQKSTEKTEKPKKKERKRRKRSTSDAKPEDNSGTAGKEKTAAVTLTTKAEVTTQDQTLAAELPSSRDYTERDVTPPLEVLQSMQNSYQSPFYPPVPFPIPCTTTPVSLAAYHHLFSSQNQLQQMNQNTCLSPVIPSTAMPFPVMPQPVSGTVVTPSGWPVHVAPGVSPAQWQQLWLENLEKQRLLSVGTTAGMTTLPTTTIVQANWGGTQSVEASVQTGGTDTRETAKDEAVQTSIEIGTEDKATTSTSPEIPASSLKQKIETESIRQVEEPSRETGTEPEATCEAEAAAPAAKLSIASLMSTHTRPVKRRRMDTKCRAQYKEMMQEFRSKAAMLVTATKVMIKENPDRQAVLESCLETSLCRYAQSLLEKFQQQT